MSLRDTAQETWRESRRAPNTPARTGPHPSQVIAVILPPFVLLLATIGWGVEPRPGTIALVLTGIVFLSEAFLPLAGKVSMWSPRPLVGLTATYMMFISPLLTLVQGPWLKFIAVPSTFDDALDRHLLISAVGAAIYKTIVVLFDVRPATPVTRPRPLSWRPIGFWSAWVLLLGVSLSASVLLLATVPLNELWLTNRVELASVTAGLGVFAFLSDWSPLLLMLAVTVSTRARLISRHLAQVLLVASALLALILTGWRGSRGTLIWPALALIILWRLLGGRMAGVQVIALGAVIAAVLVTFSVFKVTGLEGLGSGAGGSDNSSAIDAKTVAGFESVLRGDLDRTSSQALLLDRLASAPSFRLGLGVTYLAAPLELVPERWRPVSLRLTTRGELNSALLYGHGQQGLGYDTSRAFGLQGEGYINFGPVGGALVFAPFACVVVLLSRAFRRYSGSGNIAGCLCVAGLTVPCLVSLPFELDVALSYSFKVSLPLLLIAFASRRNATLP